MLCHCGRWSALWQKRHDAVLGRLGQAAVKTGKWLDVKQNNTCSLASSDATRNLRPDLQLFHEDGSVTLVDIKTTFETRTSFQDRRVENERHYSALAREIQTATNRTCRIHTFVVGVLGGYDRKNDGVLAALRIPPHFGRLMRKLMVSEVIHWSRNIWVSHVSGVVQDR